MIAYKLLQLFTGMLCAVGLIWREHDALRSEMAVWGCSAAEKCQMNFAMRKTSTFEHCLRCFITKYTVFIVSSQNMKQALISN